MLYDAMSEDCRESRGTAGEMGVGSPGTPSSRVAARSWQRAVSLKIWGFIDSSSLHTWHLPIGPDGTTARRIQDLYYSGDVRVAQVLYAPRALALDTLIPFLRMHVWSDIKAIGMTIPLTTLN